MISAEIIKDSVNAETKSRLTTFLVTFPRFINAEVLRHRALSFNSASSRAIPVEKMLQNINDNPALPEEWGKYQSGMQAFELLDESTKQEAIKVWMEAKDYAVAFSKKLYELGVAKQITNRITEPFQNITLVISGTEWENFYALRAEENAQPEFRMLAYKMLELHNDNLKNVNVVTPCDNIELLYDILTNKVTDYMEEKYWHLPFSDKHTSEMNIKDKLKVSVARCARTSYLNQDGDILPEKDFKLFDRLVTGNHYSPLEHCALCVPAAITYSLRSNFGLGWLQYRKFFNNENKTDSRLLKFSC